MSGAATTPCFFVPPRSPAERPALSALSWSIFRWSTAATMIIISFYQKDPDFNIKEVVGSRQEGGAEAVEERLEN